MAVMARGPLDARIRLLEVLGESSHFARNRTFAMAHVR